MDVDRRNPYVILGVPFGATEEEARAGFARARRRLRQELDAPYTAEDLTWALHQIEQLIASPELAVDIYRIPANPNVGWTDPIGLFNPAPHPVERHTTPDEAEWQSIRREALAAAFRRLVEPVIRSTTPRSPYE